MKVRGWGLIVGVQMAEETPFTAADVAAAVLEAGMLTVPAGPKVDMRDLPTFSTRPCHPYRPSFPPCPHPTLPAMPQPIDRN